MHNTPNFLEHDFPTKENTEATVHVVDVGEVSFAPIPPKLKTPPLHVHTARAKHLQLVPHALRFQKYPFPHLVRPIRRPNWHDLQTGAWDVPLYRYIKTIEHPSSHLPGFEKRAQIFAQFLRKHEVTLSTNERGELVRTGTYIRTAANARRLIRFVNRAYDKFTLQTLELAYEAIGPLLRMEMQRASTEYLICASHITKCKRKCGRMFPPVFIATGHVARPTCKEPQMEPCSKCPIGSWMDDRDPVTKDWQKRADDRIKLGYTQNKCPWCGDSVPSGVWLCPNCGREFQAAPLLLAGDGLEYVSDGNRHIVDGYQEIVRRKGHRAERVDRDQLFRVLDLTFPRWRDPSYVPETSYECAVQLYAVTAARRYELHVYQGWTAQEVAAHENVLAAKHGYARNIKRAAISKFVRETDEWVRRVLATFDMLTAKAKSFEQ